MCAKEATSDRSVMLPCRTKITEVEAYDPMAYVCLKVEDTGFPLGTLYEMTRGGRSEDMSTRDPVVSFHLCLDRMSLPRLIAFLQRVEAEGAGGET